PLHHASKRVRSKVGAFSRKVQVERVTVRTIDLSSKANQQQLLNSADMWLEKGSINDIAKIDGEALAAALRHADVLDIHNICLYIDGQLQGFQLFQLPPDKRYVIATFTKVNSSLPGVTEYLLHACARKWADQGISYINFEQDLGIPHLRAEKLALGPV